MTTPTSSPASKTQRHCPLGQITSRYYKVYITPRDTAITSIANPGKNFISSFVVDASKTSNDTGIGIWKESEPADDSISLGSSHSIFQVEIIAIQICEEATLNFMHDNSEVVLNCHMKLDQLAENHSITLRWMSSHSEICGKELADELVFNSSTGPEPTCVGCIKA